MAKDSDHLAGAFKTENTGGVLSGLLAEENGLDRRAMLRIGTWGAAAVGGVIIAVLANQSSLGWRREQVAAADLARQAQQLQSLGKQSQNEARQLAAAIETLNGDRDRLFSRVTVLEQGLDSVTGAIARQNSAAAAKPPVTAAAPADQPAQAPGQPPAPAIAAVTSAPVAAQAPASPEKRRAEASKPESRPDNRAETKPEAKAETKPEAKPEPSAAVAAAPPQGPPPLWLTAIPAPNASAAPAPPAAPPAMPVLSSKLAMGPPDPAAAKLTEPAREATASSPTPSAAASEAKAQAQSKDLPKDKETAKETAEAAPAADVPVQRTDFAVDLGGANSVGGLRALWRGLVKANAELAELHPIIVVKESNTGLGMQLRLAAGPLHDAAAAAKICAALIESERTCETTVFDGQRLAVGNDNQQSLPAVKPAPAAKPPSTYYRHGTPRRSQKDDTPPKEAPPAPSTFSSLFRR